MPGPHYPWVGLPSAEPANMPCEPQASSNSMTPSFLKTLESKRVPGELVKPTIHAKHPGTCLWLRSMMEIHLQHRH